MELLFAIVIFSVLAGLSLPHLGALSTQFNLDNGARAIAMALNQARVQAITRGHTVDVTFESHAFTILDVSNSDEIIAVGNIPSNVSVAFTDDVATFTPLGAAVSPLTVTITNAEGARDVSIGLSGEIQIL